MQTSPFVRVIGWASIGIGLAALVAPATLGRALGIGERRTLARVLGGRDLVLGLGLVTAGDPELWLRARLAADAGDAVLHTAGALSGHFRRGRSLATAGFATTAAAVDYALLGLGGERGA